MNVEVLYFGNHPYASLIGAYADWLHDNGHDVICGDVNAWHDCDRFRQSTELVIMQYCSTVGFGPSERAKEQGKQTIIVESPSIHADGQISVYPVDGDSMLPTGLFVLNSFFKDRLTDLGIKNLGRSERRTGNVLVLECPGSKSEAWTRDAVERVKSVMDAEVEVRAHPITQPEYTRTLQDQLIGSAFSICYDSTAISECIRMGVPYICSPESLYYPMSSDYDKITIRSRDERKKFMNGLANLQFGLEDIESGRMHERVEQIVAYLTDETPVMEDVRKIDPEETVVMDATEKPKRKRGRPRKQERKEERQERREERKEEREDKPKRKRGRPRKVEADADA